MVKEPVLNDLMDIMGFGPDKKPAEFTSLFSPQTYGGRGWNSNSYPRKRRRHSREKNLREQPTPTTNPRPCTYQYKDNELKEEWFRADPYKMVGRFEMIFPFNHKTVEVAQLSRLSHLTHPVSFSKFYIGVLQALVTQSRNRKKKLRGTQSPKSEKTTVKKTRKRKVPRSSVTARRRDTSYRSKRSIRE